MSSKIEPFKSETDCNNNLNSKISDSEVIIVSQMCDYFNCSMSDLVRLGLAALYEEFAEGEWIPRFHRWISYNVCVMCEL